MTRLTLVFIYSALALALWFTLLHVVLIETSRERWVKFCQKRAHNEKLSVKCLEETKQWNPWNFTE